MQCISQYIIYSIMSKIKNILLIIIFSTFPYIFSLDGDFVFDDSEAIVKNNDLDLKSSYVQLFYNDFWGNDIKRNDSHKSYRPLTVFTFRLNKQIDGDKLIAKNFKITNLILHVLVTLILHEYLQLLCKNANKNNEKYNLKHTSSYMKSLWYDEALLSSILFGVHPIHVEAVSGIVGRADILTALFFFLSILTFGNLKYHKRTNSQMKNVTYFILTIIFSILAMLSKEIGITALGVCCVYDFLYNCKIDSFKSNIIETGSNNVSNEDNNKNKEISNIKYIFKHLVNNHSLIFRECVLLISIISILYMRWAVMNFQGPQFQDTDNPAAFSPNKISRVATYNYIYFINFLILIWPKWLCFDWSMGCIPVLNGFYDIRIVFVLLLWLYFFTITLIILSRYTNDSQKRYYIMLLSLMIVPFLPASNTLVTVGFVIAERVIYISSSGFCALVINGFCKILKSSSIKYNKVLKTIFIMVICVMILRTIERSIDWMNEKSLYNAALDVCPLNAKVHYNIGKNAGDYNDFTTAEIKYREALRLNPNYYQAMNNLANLLKDQSRFSEAEILLKNAITIKEDFPAAWMNLGIVLANSKKQSEAENAYLNALKYRRKYADCFYNLGNLYLDQKRHDMALNAWYKATEINPQHAVAWSNTLALLDNTGQIERALKLAPLALSVLPNVASIHFNIANLLGKSGDFPKAEKHFSEAIKLKEIPPAIYYANLGVLYHRWKKTNQAIEMYKKALSIDNSLKSARENLQMLLDK